MQALWRINGLGASLTEAIDVLTDNQFTDWQLGVSLEIPLGVREASARVQATELAIQKERAQLRQSVHATTHRLNDVVREIDSLYEQYQAADERLQAANEWLDGARIRFENPPPALEGQDALLQALNTYQVALQAWANAARDTSDLIARYNVALARLEEEKGTLLAARNIAVQSDPVARVRSGRARLPRLTPTTNDE